MYKSRPISKFNDNSEANDVYSYIKRHTWKIISLHDKPDCKLRSIIRFFPVRNKIPTFIHKQLNPSYLTPTVYGLSLQYTMKKF